MNELSSLGHIFIAALGAAIGLALGSFISVISHRLPRGQSIIAPPSHCPSCRTSLQVRDLIPLLSWAMNNGKCRTCRTPIPYRYPLLEAFSGALCALLLITHPISLDTALALGMIVCGLSLAVIDLEQTRRPLRLFACLIIFSALHLLLQLATKEHGALFPLTGLLMAGLCLHQARKLAYQRQMLWLGIIPLTLAMIWFPAEKLLPFAVIAGLAVGSNEYLYQEEEIEQRYLLASLMISFLIILAS